MADLDYQRLADYVISRRTQLDYDNQDDLASAADVSSKTVQRVEAAIPVRSSTLGKLERALKWAPGSLRAILAGGNPTPIQMEKPARDLRSDPDYLKWRNDFRKLRAKGYSGAEAVAALTDEDQRDVQDADRSEHRSDAG